MEIQPSRDFDFVKKPKTRRKIKVSKKKKWLLQWAKG
jgi:hypothetical protein